MAQQGIMDGKKPLSEKPQPKQGRVVTDDLFGNAFHLSDEIKKELKDQGLEARFVNAKTIYENQGYHNKGWKVYKRKKDATLTSDFRDGKDPEGIIRRGDCILAVKEIAQANAHRALLKQRAERYKSFKKEQAAKLRQAAKESGLDTRIDENDGYEDEE
jgi:hypothetical protein